MGSGVADYEILDRSAVGSEVIERSKALVSFFFCECQPNCICKVVQVDLLEQLVGGS